MPLINEHVLRNAVGFISSLNSAHSGGAGTSTNMNINEERAAFWSATAKSS